jgi:hypothetical protein
VKKNLFILCAAFFFIQPVFSQHYYEVLPDRNGSTFFKGIIAKDVLLNDNACAKWYGDNLKGFTPNAQAVDALRRNISNIQLLVFMGTWCNDSS